MTIKRKSKKLKKVKVKKARKSSKRKASRKTKAAKKVKKPRKVKRRKSKKARKTRGRRSKLAIAKIVKAAEKALRKKKRRARRPEPIEPIPAPAPAPVIPLRVKVLARGAEITAGDRNASYGDPLENFEAIAALKRAFWDAIHNGNNDPLIQQNTAVGHAMDMVFTNIGRIASAPSLKAMLEIDRAVDGATYIAIFHELLVREHGHKV